ncbi:phosphotransferase enzyme family protein [Microbacterium pumilum]|uniref:phosphotransferase enzyme family protein n=1 Tax=Microbacterium pumilum TaxID=344165 RepID=UPI0031DCB6E8
MPSRRAQIAQLRLIALAALREYPLPHGRLTFVTHGENTTFRHDSAAGRHLVRVHRPQRHGQGVDGAAAIRSEIAWMRSIRADTELEVPDAVAARDGSQTVRATAAGETRDCSVLRWMDGRIHEDSARPVHLHRLGAAMAVLHDQADAWAPPDDFVRIRWDHEAFFGNVMVYGGIPAAECWNLLPAPLRARFEAVGERMVDVMASAEDVGLIHADLHAGNAVFEGDRVKLIDFDDCGTGPRMYELAVAVWELRDRPDYPLYLEALRSGYLTGRDTDLAQLDDYIALRQVAFDLWYTGTAQINPAFAARLDVVHDWSLEMLDIVEHRKPSRPAV